MKRMRSALPCALGLLTGNEEAPEFGALRTNVFAVMTYAPGPWAIHSHLGYTRNYHNGPDQRDHIYHGSVALE